MSKKRPQRRTTKKPSEAKGVVERRSANMEDFHCEMFQLNFPLTAEQLDKAAFLKAASMDDDDEYTDDEGEVDVVRSFGNREGDPQYHAHMRVRLNKEGKGRVEVGFHESPMGVEDKKPPYAEDCVQWLGKFIKVEEVAGHIHTAYTFDKSFTSIIALPFPLVTAEKALAGSTVSGLSVLLPKELPSDMAIVQWGGDETYLSLSASYKVNLKNFDLAFELERLSTSVNSLIKKQETDDESGDASKVG